MWVLKCINGQNSWFASIFLVYVLSDHSIILRKCTPGWRGCKIACKGGLFFYPPKQVTSPTWVPPPPCKQDLNLLHFCRSRWGRRRCCFNSLLTKWTRQPWQSPFKYLSQAFSSLVFSAMFDVFRGCSEWGSVTNESVRGLVHNSL